MFTYWLVKKPLDNQIFIKASVVSHGKRLNSLKKTSIKKKNLTSDNLEAAANPLVFLVEEDVRAHCNCFFNCRTNLLMFRTPFRFNALSNFDLNAVKAVALYVDSFFFINSEKNCVPETFNPEELRTRSKN